MAIFDEIYETLWKWFDEEMYFLYFLLTVSMSKPFNLCYTTKLFFFFLFEISLNWQAPFNNQEALKQVNLIRKALINSTK